MDDCAATVGVATLAPVGLGDARATLQHRSAAAAVAATLAAATALALTYGLGHGPEIKPIVPVAAAVWSLADLLTATLLLAQFCINGRVSFAILSTAYAMSALLTWPFVLAFPGVIAPRPLGPGHQDVFVYFWMIWHCTFPLLVLASTFNDSPRKRFVSRRAILVVAIATVLGPLLLSGALAVTLFASRDALPQLVIEGRLQPLDRFLFHPAVVLLNLLACGVLARRGAKLTTLRLWLCVAMFSACLDSLLVNLGGATYSYAWDVGKIVADSTAFVVLCMILCELLLLYRQQLRLSEKLARDLGARERSEARLTLDVRARRDALYESERRYRSLAEALPHIVWTAGADGALDHFNQRTLAYTGKTLKELEGAAWLSVLHPGDVENARATWIRSVMEGTPYEIEFRIRRADGAYRWHLGAALPIRDATGSISKWFGTCTDIDDQRLASEAAGRLAEQMRLNETLEQDLLARERAEAALRASDERFQQVEAHSPIGLALVALDGRFMRVNPALSAIAGLGTAELLASTCRQLTHPDDFAADLANVERMLKDGSLNFEMEMRYVRASGEAVWVLTNCSLVRDDAGRPDYFIRQIQDISQRKIAEQELRVAETSALAAVEAKSRFLATMSHELRTPMNGIIGMTELLTLSTLSEDQSEYVKVVRDSGESLLRVLNDILDYSKIEAGKLDLEAVDFNLSSQIDSVFSLLERQYEVKGVALCADVEATLPASLRGDPGRVRQILVNLVGNALKFTPAGGDVRLTVAHEPGAAATSVRFTVTDTGVGIAPEARHRLFQPFSQVDGSTTRNYGGTGLGLSICKQLVDLMGGSIGVEGAERRGSSFWFTISFLPAESIAPAAPPARETTDRRVARPRAERLLIAEDNEVNTLLATRQFERLGFAVTIAVNGRRAVEACRAERFDMIFMDCHMPVLDGLEATREIRRLLGDGESRMPIVAMTANVQAEERAACLCAGMDDFLSKPVSLTNLETMLERWLPERHESPLKS